MIANHGYKDGSGEYYISIDTDKCSLCAEYGCLDGCPGQIFEVEFDDWDDEVATVRTTERNKLKQICAACKPVSGRPERLPCQIACVSEAITHSW